MKTFYAAVMLLTLTLFTGCFKQDYSLCIVEDNCVLLFELEGAAGSSEFTNTIPSVDVALFDADGNLTAHRTIGKSDLEAFRGVRLTVEPGTYYAVAWGNVTANTQLSTVSGGTAFADSYLATVSGATGDNLYYAPKKSIEDSRPAGVTPDYTIYRVEVPADETATKTLTFTRANRRVNVYLKGFPVKPDVLLQEYPDKYDYYLRAFDSRKDYRQSTAAVQNGSNGDRMELASFRFPITSFETAMTVDLVSGNDTLESLGLRQWVQDNAASIEDTNEIDILFTYGADAAISITVPDWNNNDVGPIW